MELWLDTINNETIQYATKRLKISGITTNPTILSQSKLSLLIQIEQLLNIQSGMVAIQLTENKYSSMIRQAETLTTTLAKYNKRIIIKIPVTEDGLHAIKYLSNNNIQTLATAIYEPRQIILSVLAGANYGALYFGRIQQNQMTILKDILTSIHNNNYHIKLMIAAIKNVNQIIMVNKLGVHAITIPNTVFQEFINNNPNTIDSINKFTNDWNNRTNPTIDINNF